MMRRQLAVCVLLGFCLAGCGGGGSESSSAPPATDFAMGTFEGRAAATNPPVTTAASSTVATGITGSFTLLRLRDQRVDLNDTRIAVTTNKSGSGDVYLSNIDGSNSFRLTKTFDVQEAQPAWNNSGNKVAFQGAQNDGLYDRDIFVYRSDGVFLQKVTNTPSTYEANPEWSPDGTKLIYDRSTALQVYTFGGSEVTLDTGGNAFDPAWSTRNQLAFVTSRNGTQDIFVSNVDGSSPSGVITSGDAELSPTFSPDGETLYCIRYDGANRHIVRHRFLFFGSSTDTIYTTSDVITSLDVSPDGEWVLFENDTANSIQRVHRTGGLATSLFAIPDAGHGVAWGPLPGDRLIVGVGGLLATSAAGFIFADSNDRTQSVLAFDCVTRSSAILREQTGIGGTQDSLVFVLDADTVKLLKYANAPDWNAMSVIEAGTAVPTANGALISISAIDGKVNAVLPFVGTRGVDSKAAITREGSNYVFTGQFLSAIDGSGKNVAPSGASRVVLDATGTLTAG
jgi:hypothetical protein